MNYKIVLVLLLIIKAFVPAIAQKEAFNWYFGNGCALTFNTPGNKPAPLPPSNMNAGEGSSCISDESGRLIMYTDGVDVWNASGLKINKQELDGHSSTTQSALIVKKPGLDQIYYIFTLDAGSYVSPPNGGLTYSIVDMSENGGSGLILKYNVHLRDSMTEKMSAVFAENGKDLWVLAHDWQSNNFVAYLITDKGITDTVISSVGSVYDGDPQNNIGYMKFSANSRFIVSTVFFDDYAELLKFDDKTGLVSDPVKIQFDSAFYPYGAEFSVSGKKLYISGLFAKKIYQFSTENYDSTSIAVSEQLIADDTIPMSLAALQIAPNGKIYVARQETEHLGAINNPDGEGFSCYYDSAAVPMPHTDSYSIRKGLPNTCQTFYDFRIIFDYHETCEGDQLYVKAKAYPGVAGMKYQWIGPNGFNSNGAAFAFYGATHSFDGKYHVNVSFNSLTARDSISILVRDNPDVKILGKKSIAAGESIKLRASKISSDFNYLWSTGETSPEITVSQDGKYSLTTTGLYGCISSDSTQLAKLSLGLTSDKSVLNIGQSCIGESIDAKINLKNNDDSEQIIDSLYFLSGDNKFIILNLPSIPYSMNSHSAFDLDVRFKSLIPGNFTDTLVVVVRDFELNKVKIAFNAKAAAVADFSLNDLTGGIGFPDTLRVWANLTCGSVPLRTNLNFTLSYDATFFMPLTDSVPNLDSSYIKNDVHYLDFSISDTVLTTVKKEVANIPGYFLVGSSPETKTYVNEISADNTNIAFNNGEGSITLTGCAVPIRPISFFTPFDVDLPQVLSSENLSGIVKGAQSGEMNFAVFNLNGDLLKKSAQYFTLPGDKTEFSLQIKNIPSGLYFLVVSQNGSRIYKKFIKNN